MDHGQEKRLSFFKERRLRVGVDDAENTVLEAALPRRQHHGRPPSGGESPNIELVVDQHGLVSLQPAGHAVAGRGARGVMVLIGK